MTLFFIKILVAHLVGDFVLQPSKWVKNKEKKKLKSKYLYLHLAVHLVLLALVVQFDALYIWPVIFLVFSHGCIDVAKLYAQNNNNKRTLFFVDQAAHLLSLFAVSLWYFQVPLANLKITPQMWLLTACILLVTTVAAMVMRVFISKWKPHKKEAAQQDHAGAVIGMLERLFVFGFVVLNFWPGIGFLLAAKSIFRFGDLTRAKDRQLTEYILIGTLLSFGIAILVGLAYRACLPII